MLTIMVCGALVVLVCAVILAIPIAILAALMSLLMIPDIITAGLIVGGCIWFFYKCGDKLFDVCMRVVKKH